MSITDYGKTRCSYCGKIISRCGFAVTNHGRMHVRKGDCIEVADKENGYPGSSEFQYLTTDAKLDDGIRGLGLSRWQVDFNKNNKKLAKHDWLPINGGIKDLGAYGRRKCRNCGSEQAKYPQSSWGKIIGYRWEPLAGKCSA